MLKRPLECGPWDELLREADLSRRGPVTTATSVRGRRYALQRPRPARAWRSRSAPRTPSCDDSRRRVRPANIGCPDHRRGRPGGKRRSGRSSCAGRGASRQRQTANSAMTRASFGRASVPVLCTWPGRRSAIAAFRRRTRPRPAYRQGDGRGGHRRDLRRPGPDTTNDALRLSSTGYVPEHAHAVAGLGRCLLALGETEEGIARLMEARATWERLRATPRIAEIDALLAAAPTA